MDYTRFSLSPVVALLSRKLHEHLCNVRVDLRSKPLRLPVMSRTSLLPPAARNRCRIQLGCLLTCLFAAVGSTLEKPVPESQLAAAQREPLAGVRFHLQRGDVVAFVGGADVEAAQQGGHLEALLAARYRGLDVRFRNFGWEGDTVQARPRDVNFPPLREHLRRVGATVVVLQFGRTEALGGGAESARFVGDYGKLLDECAQQTQRLTLVTPPPFEKGGGLLPDL